MVVFRELNNVFVCCLWIFRCGYGCFMMVVPIALEFFWVKCIIKVCALHFNDCF